MVDFHPEPLPSHRPSDGISPPSPFCALRSAISPPSHRGQPPRPQCCQGETVTGKGLVARIIHDSGV
jgi:hypothetical protein